MVDGRVVVVDGRADACLTTSAQRRSRLLDGRWLGGSGGVAAAKRELRRRPFGIVGLSAGLVGVAKSSDVARRSGD
jgi:hypothetical protein